MSHLKKLILSLGVAIIGSISFAYLIGGEFWIELWAFMRRTIDFHFFLLWASLMTAVYGIVYAIQYRARMVGEKARDEFLAKAEKEQAEREERWAAEAKERDENWAKVREKFNDDVTKAFGNRKDEDSDAT